MNNYRTLLVIVLGIVFSVAIRTDQTDIKDNGLINGNMQRNRGL